MQNSKTARAKNTVFFIVLGLMLTARYSIVNIFMEFCSFKDGLVVKRKLWIDVPWARGLIEST
jgi:hypothetical protein